MTLILILILVMSCIGMIYIRNNYKKGHYYLRDIEVDTIYYILKCVNESGLNYFTIGGTLLGSIRHGGLIPWDDDGDIAILREDESNLLKINWNNWGLELVPSWFGYKLIRKNSSFPFIDIFVMKLDTQYGYYHYDNEKARKHWENDWITKDQLFPLVKKQFGSLQVRCPNKSVEYLKRTYGDDVMTHYYEEYSHRINRKKNKRKRRLPHPIPVCV